MVKTILLADDDRNMCEIILRWLMDEGYAVTPLLSLRDAKRFQEIVSFDLVITDDLDGGGVKWAAELHRADQKVLITSVKPGAEGVPRLTKIFTKEQLLKVVAEMLSPKPSPTA